VLPLRSHLIDHAPDEPPVQIELRTGDRPVAIEVRGGEVAVRAGSVVHPDVTITGGPGLVLGLLTGDVDLTTAIAAGLQVDGDRDVLRRVQPLAAPPRARTRPGARPGTGGRPPGGRGSRRPHP